MESSTGLPLDYSLDFHQCVANVSSRRVWVIGGVAAAVLIVVAVLYVWLSRMRGEEG
jgi:hypothetical protein